MNNLWSHDKTYDWSCQELRKRLAKRQADLKAQFKSELDQVPSDDILSHMRVKIKYRQLGLNI